MNWTRYGALVFFCLVVVGYGSQRLSISQSSLLFPQPTTTPRLRGHTAFTIAAVHAEGTSLCDWCDLSHFKLTPIQLVSVAAHDHIVSAMNSGGLVEDPAGKGPLRIVIEAPRPSLRANTVPGATAANNGQTWNHRLTGGADGDVRVEILDATRPGSLPLEQGYQPLAPSYLFGGPAGICAGRAFPTPAAEWHYGSELEIHRTWMADRERIVGSLIQQASSQALDQTPLQD